MTTAWKVRLTLACLALLVAALATAYGQEALRRFPAISELDLEPPAAPSCQRLPDLAPPANDSHAPSSIVRFPALADRTADVRESVDGPRLDAEFSAAPEAATNRATGPEELRPPVSPEPDAWWEPFTQGPLRPASTAGPVDVDALVLWALRHSSQVRAISDNYLIQRTAITEAAAAFDVRTFTDTRWIRVNEPVGNTLTTGGPSRYLNDNFKVSAGVKKKTFSGGTLELSQRIGLQDSNSVFFQPINQGNSRLSLSFSQPLLSRGGRAYNNSVTVLAEIDTRMAQDQTSQELQDHLLKVTKTYWELHLARSALLQKRRLFERGRLIQIELDGRQDVDAAQNQLVRARAAVSSRRAELVRAEAAIKNAEARIRALVNAPELLAQTQLELVPTELPAREFIPIDLEDARATALKNRPEVDLALQQIQAAHVRLNVSKNELRPVVDLVLESYVTGLQGQYNIGDSLAQQFNQGAPSYTAGLVYEYPWHNRAAKARHARRQLELRRVMEQFNAALSQLSAEVEIAVREVQTTYGEVQSKRQAMQALQVELNYLTERWQLLPGDDRSASFLLGDLLDVQERLGHEEFAFVKAQTDYTLSLAELKRVTGTLLCHEQITPHEVLEDGAPRIIFDKAQRGEPFVAPSNMYIEPATSEPPGEHSLPGPSLPPSTPPLPPPAEPVPPTAPPQLNPRFPPPPLPEVTATRSSVPSQRK